MTNDTETQRRQRAAAATQARQLKPQPQIDWDEAIARVKDILEHYHPEAPA
jgi:hypothetical protein